MKKQVLGSILLCFFTVVLTAQNNKHEQDINAIKSFCGCFKVNFNYTETFSPKEGYEKHADYNSGALEWAELIEDSDNKLSIQHLLVVMDTMVIKHWRQDWLFENQNIFHFEKDDTWNFKTVSKEEVKGQWTQKVYQVDDSPRYSGSSTWVHVDGKHYWENKSDSPLPRREYSKRSDYQVMIRGNRQEVTETGWIHEQDNDKVIRIDGQKDVLLAQEKGMNTYVRVPDEECIAAKNWWKNNQKFWSKVRKSWEPIYDREGTLGLKKRAEKKPLYKHMYKLEADNASKKEISKALQLFVMEDAATKK